MSLCEVRIPTYKRPSLLKRAIDSLLKQSYKHWVAIVMDDSPEREGKEVINYFDDERIIYSPNKARLGITGNLDRAFQSTGYKGGSYAFVLEDDNYLFPNFIDANIKSLKQHNVAVMLRNQEIRLQINDRSLPTGKTTRGVWFTQKFYSPEELYPYLFFITGISNGGLFWNTNEIKSDLQVGPEIHFPWCQEIFRCLQIVEKICFEREPLCVFTKFKNRNDIDKSSTREQKAASRARQSISMYMLKRYGPQLAMKAQKVADRLERRQAFEQQLLDGLYLSYDFRYIKGAKFISALIKSFLRYVLVGDPLKEQYKKGYYRYN